MATTRKAEPETTPMNVLQKLLAARVKFLEANVRKSGKNMKLKYTYFELDDIVPTATMIFRDLGLLPVTTFSNEIAKMTIYNCDDPADTVEFTSPMRDIEPIISSTTGGEVTNAIQRLGSVETYQRRYLYMIALDIVEADEMEAMTGLNPEAPADVPVQKAPPATPLERQEIKQELTATEAPADELLTNALKAAVKKLRLAGGNDDRCVKIALDTHGFTEVSKSKAEALINAINTELETKKEGAENEQQ